MTRFARFSKQSELPTLQHKIYNANQGKRIVILDILIVKEGKNHNRSLF